MPNKALPSAGLIVYINSRPLGVVTGFRWSSDTARKEVRGVDCAQPLELGSTVTRITGQINLIRTHGDGGLEGQGVAAAYSDFTREKYFTLMVFDRVTDMPIFRADNCSVTNQSWEAPAKGLVSGNFSFLALDWGNEFHS